MGLTPAQYAEKIDELLLDLVRSINGLPTRQEQITAFGEFVAKSMQLPPQDLRLIATDIEWKEGEEAVQ